MILEVLQSDFVSSFWKNREFLTLICVQNLKQLQAFIGSNDNQFGF